ncbi:THAP domain-containing protein 5 [Misgurnus anguillicaudatus]|uniref:THAP domain-containing protein 5 n=1 Tax=Misgurnus anguillicaudatus TaxID=75329 RepID=UPI003CCF19E1
MEACDFCKYNRDGKGDAVSFYRFPLDKEKRRRWITNMGRDAGWTPSESSSLCSAHFTSDCFESGSAHLHSNAIPTLFNSTQPMNLNTENDSQDQGVRRKSIDSSLSPCCDCNERLRTIEKAYQLKIAAAQLQIKEHKKSLEEESRKATQWQKKAIVLQSAIRAMRLRGSIPTRKKSSTPKANNLD